MAASQWPEAAADAACSVELKTAGEWQGMVEKGYGVWLRWDAGRMQSRWVKEGRGEVESESAEGARELRELEGEVQRHLEREK